jgi:hypothetical protein
MTSDSSIELFLLRLLHVDTVLQVLADDLVATKTSANWLAELALLLLVLLLNHCDVVRSDLKMNLLGPDPEGTSQQG